MKTNNIQQKYNNIYNNFTDNLDFNNIINEINELLNENHDNKFIILLLYIKSKCYFHLLQNQESYDTINELITHYRNDNEFKKYENKIYALYFDNCGHLNKYNEMISLLSSYIFDISDKEVYMRINWWIRNNLFNNIFNDISKYYHMNRNYTFEKYNKLKFKFNKSSEIFTNYSEMMQDIFVLSILNGKEKGTYLEFGSAEFDFHNNTYLLEKNYNWTGLSIDYNEEKVNIFNDNRKNKCIYGNALDINYDSEFFNQITNNNRIDYLQLDLDPNTITLEVLKKLPLDKIRFSVITFEHDKYYTNDDVQNESREILINNDYLLVGRDICCSLYLPFEDWYVDKKILNDEIISIINKLFISNKYNGDVNKIFYENK